MNTVDRKAAPVGKYSATRVVTLGRAKLIYISGLTSGPDAPFDVRAQADIIFRKMEALIAQEGGGLRHLVKITAYLVDMREYGAYNEVRNRIFADVDAPPASATVGVSELVRPEARIEIDGVACIEG